MTSAPGPANAPLCRWPTLLLLLLAVLFASAWAAAPQPQPTHPARAGQSAADLGSLQWLRQAERAPGLRSPDRPGAAADWQPVTLGDNWRRQHPPLQGRYSYRLQFRVPEQAGAWAVLVPRLGDRARLYVNGRLRAELGSPGDAAGEGEDHSGWPQLLTLDASDLRAGDNQLWVQLEGTGWRLSGLSQVLVGPRAPVVARYRQALLWQLVMAGAVLGMCAGVTLLAGGYALGWQRRGPPLMLAAAAALWGLRSVLWWWPDGGLPAAARLMLLDLGFGSSLALACAAALRLGGLPSRRWWWLLLGLALLQGPVALAVALGAPVQWRGWLLDAQVLLCVAVLGRLLWRAAQPGQGPARVLGLGGLALLVFSGHDHWYLFFSSAPDAMSRPYLTPLGLPVFLLACGWLLVWRVRRALRAEALAQRLRERREGLRRQAAERERQRLLRQLHDGLGAQLTSLLSAVQRRSIGPTEIEQGLVDTLDELRLSLDLMDEPGTDLGELLGQLRFRLEPRLRQAGLQLRWQMPVQEALPPPPGLQQPGGADHLRRWVQEVLTNVLKHARATQVTVSAGPGWLSIEDDGIGLGDAPVPGRGLRHLAERAQALQARLEWAPGPQPPRGCRVSLRWDVHSSRC